MHFLSARYPHPILLLSIFINPPSIYSAFERDLALITLLRSKTGRSGSGSSIIWIICAKNRYHPSTSHAKKQAPVAWIHQVALGFPVPVKYTPAVPKPKAVEALTKSSTKIRLVRSEPSKNTTDRRRRATG